MRIFTICILMFALLATTALAEDESEWTIIDTEEDGSTYSINKKSITHLDGDLFRIWVKEAYPPSYPISKIVTLLEVDCRDGTKHMIRSYILKQNREVINEDYSWMPYEWEPLNDVEHLMFWFYCLGPEPI